MRTLGAIASLGCTDLLPPEHVLLLARPRLQELSAGSSGPVTNKATKILRHLEASCRQRPSARRPLAEPSPAAAHLGPSDLLTDAVPLARGQAFLQPLSSALSPTGPTAPLALDRSPLSVLGDTGEAGTRPAGPGEQETRSEQGLVGTDTPNGGPEFGPGPSGCLWSPEAGGSHNSLFAGMELMAWPRLVETGTAAEESPQPPQTSSQRLAAKGPPSSEPSAFTFLNS
nr:TEPSIN adaptor related protein complex 4 accessory protein [Molossus molossus]